VVLLVLRSLHSNNSNGGHSTRKRKLRKNKPTTQLLKSQQNIGEVIHVPGFQRISTEVRNIPLLARPGYPSVYKYNVYTVFKIAPAFYAFVLLSMKFYVIFPFNSFIPIRQTTPNVFTNRDFNFLPSNYMNSKHCHT
jgi:hypothetical protein